MCYDKVGVTVVDFRTANPRPLQARLFDQGWPARWPRGFLKMQPAV